MLTLKQFNEIRYEKLVELEIASKKMKMANVACDKCGHEMYYPDPNMVLASNPPKMVVRCSNVECNNQDYKVR